jgi:hypothetical protein
MLKKKLIFSLLLFFYTVVLAHNAVPHGHFDELISSEHESDSHDHNDQSSHHHHYLFSHSISFHVTIEKQIIFSTIRTKDASNSFPNRDTFCLIPAKQFFTHTDTYWTLVHIISELPLKAFCSYFFNRGPPISR